MFESIARLMRGKRKVIVMHGNADMDALGSAYALSKLYPSADIFAPNGMDRVAGMVAEKMGATVLDDCDLSSYELVVVVDSSAPMQLETEQDVPADAIVIDHHVESGDWDGHPSFIDSSRTSCCEIVLDMFDEEGAELDRDTGLMLLGGMITDGGTFQFADPRLLRAFANIMERCDIPMDEAMELTRAPDSISERVATIKALERTKFDRVGTLIVATAVAGSFESSVCKALLCAGADVAFVASQRDDMFRMSSRATQDAVRRGVNLGSILKGLGDETSSAGGGHDGAAGISGIGDAEAMLHMCTCSTMEVLRDNKMRETAQKEGVA